MSGPPATPRQGPTTRERAEALHAEGLGTLKIAKRLGVPRGTVRGWVAPGNRCPECGGPKHCASRRCRSCEAAQRKGKPRREARERMAVVARRYAAGALVEDLAAELDVTTGAIHGLLTRARKLGLSTGPRRKRGPRSSGGGDVLRPAQDWRRAT